MSLSFYEDVEKNIDNLEYLKTLITPLLKRERVYSLKRSALMVSAHNIKHLNKMDKLQCDTIIVNLEDGVAKEKKELARVLTGVFLSNKKNISKEIVVRVNPLDECGIQDIEFLNKVKPHAIRIPKIKTKEDVLKAVELIDKDIEIHLSCETKEAYSSIIDLKVSERVTTIYLGILDLLADLNIPHSIINLDNPTVDYILSKFLIDSKIAGFISYSFVYQDHKNLVEFKKWCEKEKIMGFSGKSCISPNQITIANEVFSPSKADLEKAEEIIKLFEFNQKNGITGFVSEKYGFIDEPIYKGAKVVLGS